MKKIRKDLIMDVSVGLVLKGLPHLHFNLCLLRDVCFADKDSLSQSVRQWGGDNLSIYIKGLPAVFDFCANGYSQLWRLCCVIQSDMLTVHHSLTHLFFPVHFSCSFLHQLEMVISFATEPISFAISTS